MAQLLVRTVDGENAQRYMRGDVVAVFEDGHQFGRMESLTVWVAEGRDPKGWPGGFAIVQIAGLTVAQAAAYVAEGNGTRRGHKVDLDAIERRTVGSGRDTLNTQGQIKRNWDDADVRAAFIAKG